MLALAAACLVQGCTPAPRAASGTRLYHSDLTGGAKTCVVPDVTIVDGKTVQATMTVGNDGGWCGITVAQSGGTPYSAGLLTARPLHGTIYIHTVGDSTRVDYTPDARFTGSDKFTVSMIPGNGSLQVAVTVKP
jgi:hypothetical protein